MCVMGLDVLVHQFRAIKSESGAVLRFPLCGMK